MKTKSSRKNTPTKAPDPDQMLHAALALYEKGESEEGANLCEQALRLDGNRPDGWTLLGMLYRKTRRFDQAEAAHRRAITLKPDYADAWNNLCSTYQDQARLEEAEQACRQALALQPGNVSALTNLGGVLQNLGRIDEAILAYEKILWLNPQDAEAHWNLALAQLLTGDFRRGWMGYEWRWLTRMQPLKLTQPRWCGERLDGKTIFIYTEQGFGDAIQFARFVPLVAARGGKVYLQVRPELLRLFSSLEGVAHLFSWESAPANFDVHCPLLSLAGALDIRLENLPAKVPYLDSKAVPASALQKIAAASGLKVAMVWAGNVNVKNDHWRSPRLHRLAPLLAVPGVSFFSIQMGDGRKDLERVPLPAGFVDLADDLKDFADTAAVLKAVDLVITSDTSVVHLAGALGCRTWVMLHAYPDWRWMLGREDSPWYPGMRLFRQPRLGDWDTPMASMVAALRELATGYPLPGEAATIASSPPEATAPLALAVYQDSQYEQALAYCDALLARDARRYDLHTLRGMALRALKRYAEAEVAYLQAIGLAPAYGHAYRNLGNLYAEMGRGEEAGKAYRQAEQLAA